MQLGVPAIRRYYDPQLQKFPHRQVAQDAFLAGNDLLYLSRFALTDNWPDQFAAIKETILFFQSKYQDDSEFRGTRRCVGRAHPADEAAHLRPRTGQRRSAARDRTTV